MSLMELLEQVVAVVAAALSILYTTVVAVASAFTVKVATVLVELPVTLASAVAAVADQAVPPDRTAPNLAERQAGAAVPQGRAVHLVVAAAA
jgi:hypothetical protein